MPDLVRFLIRHALIGFIVAILFVAAILVFDFANLRTLASQSSAGLLAILLLALFIGLTFASVQMGYAIWTEGARKDEE
ncbi:MAG: hypothetical protein AAFX09_07870 [Pseudomonadota bacterium]